MLRTILSIISGVVIAFGLVFLADALFHILSPAPQAPADPNDREAMGAYVARQPAALLAGLTLGWAVASFVGSAVATAGARRGAWPGWVVGGLFLLATAANFAMVPHPGWMVVMAAVLILLATWLGTRVPALRPRRR